VSVNTAHYFVCVCVCEHAHACACVYCARMHSSCGSSDPHFFTCCISFYCPQIWCRWLKYLSFIFYAYNLLLKIEFGDREIDCEDFYRAHPDATQVSRSCTKEGEKRVLDLGMQNRMYQMSYAHCVQVHKYDCGSPLLIRKKVIFSCLD